MPKCDQGSHWAELVSAHESYNRSRFKSRNMHGLFDVFFWFLGGGFLALAFRNALPAPGDGPTMYIFDECQLEANETYLISLCLLDIGTSRSIEEYPSHFALSRTIFFWISESYAGSASPLSPCRPERDKLRSVEVRPWLCQRRMSRPWCIDLWDIVRTTLCNPGSVSDFFKPSHLSLTCFECVLTFCPPFGMRIHFWYTSRRD